MHEKLKPLWLNSLRQKLIKIGAKVVRHGRYVTFQLVEVVPGASLCLLNVMLALSPLGYFDKVFVCGKITKSWEYYYPGSRSAEARYALSVGQAAGFPG